MPLKISRAARPDLDQVGALLAAAGLPALRRDVPLSNVIVGLEGRTVIGAVGLEVSGLVGVLAFAVVAEGHTRKGTGASLVQALLARANELGLRGLYLFTDRAKDFFTGLGFVEIPLEGVPPQIRSTHAYQQRPDSAPAFFLEIAARYM